MAPPTPTTTPITVLRVSGVIPEGLPLLLPARPGVGIVDWLVITRTDPSSSVWVVTMVMVTSPSPGAGSSFGPSVGDGEGLVREGEVGLGVRVGDVVGGVVGAVEGVVRDGEGVGSSEGLGDGEGEGEGEGEGLGDGEV